jgi:hypothetical protein
MRIVIRSSSHGERIPADVVDEKKKEARRRILAAGFQYLEFPATLGSFDTGGKEIQEDVTVIESMVEQTYA